MQVQADEIIRAKADLKIAVCLPALNEERTIGKICKIIRKKLMSGSGSGESVVDELLVIDDNSHDRTAEMARKAGARVISVGDYDLQPETLLGTSAKTSQNISKTPTPKTLGNDGDDAPPAAGKRGKGTAMFVSVQATDADIIVWCDADLKKFDESCILKLIEPFFLPNPKKEAAPSQPSQLSQPSREIPSREIPSREIPSREIHDKNGIMLVKGYYSQRTLGKNPSGGGRNAMLVARPLICLLFPHLADVADPLVGEYAIRRSAALEVPFMCGYGVEFALLADIAQAFGHHSIAQANLGTRAHNNKPLPELSVQAAEIMQTALLKAGIHPGQMLAGPEWSSLFMRPDYDPVEIDLCQLQPLVDPQLPQA